MRKAVVIVIFLETVPGNDTMHFGARTYLSYLCGLSEQAKPAAYD